MILIKYTIIILLITQSVIIMIPSKLAHVISIEIICIFSQFLILAVNINVF